MFCVGSTENLWPSETGREREVMWSESDNSSRIMFRYVFGRICHSIRLGKSILRLLRIQQTCKNESMEKRLGFARCMIFGLVPVELYG